MSQDCNRVASGTAKSQPDGSILITTALHGWDEAYKVLVEGNTTVTVFNALAHLPRENGRHFTDDIFRCIFVNENFCTLIEISLKFVLIDNKPVLVRVMAWRRTGDKLLSEPVLTQFTDGFMRHNGEMS